MTKLDVILAVQRARIEALLKLGAELKANAETLAHELEKLPDTPAEPPPPIELPPPPVAPKPVPTPPPAVRQERAYASAKDMVPVDDQCVRRTLDRLKPPEKWVEHVSGNGYTIRWESECGQRAAILVKTAGNFKITWHQSGSSPISAALGASFNPSLAREIAAWINGAGL